MKSEITAFDLHFLAKELQSLANEWLDKIYILEKRGILLTFGNKAIIQATPGKIWAPSAKPETPDRIHPFAAQLRKLIGNSKVNKIEQICSERILSIQVLRSNKNLVLYLELFARGNAVLCDAQGIVMAALATNQRVRKGQPYALPESTDTFHLSEHDFALRFSQSADNASKTLAVQLGLGRTLAEELCVRTGTPATDKATPEHAKDIYPELMKILGQQPKPQIILENSIVIDATPVPFDIYANKKRENVEKFGEALARVFAVPASAVKEQKLAPMQQQLKKIGTMISMQQKNLAELEAKATEEHKKGEYMYEHYQEIKQLLTDIIEAKKTMSWKEVKQKFAQIKEINEATGDVVVEI